MPASYTALSNHVIFSTKDRKPYIATDITERLYAYIGGIIANKKGRLIAAGGIEDHVHLLVSFHPTTAVAEMLRLIKTNSSGWVHDTWPDKAEFGWQDGYGAFSVNVSNLDQVKAYIANQREHHKRVTFQEEFIDFLERYQIPYDERYIWQIYRGLTPPAIDCRPFRAKQNFARRR